MTQKSTSASALSACGQLVRQHDPERFLAALFAPATERERIFAVLAFNQEIARIREQVREPMMGLIRLQWWREALEASTPPAHEVLLALRATAVPVEPLLALITAREQDFADEPLDGASAYSAYAAATAAPLCEALGEPGGRDAATGYALVGLLRSGRAKDWQAELQPQVDALLARRVRGQAGLWRALARFYVRRRYPAHNHPLRVWPLLWEFLRG